MILSRVVRHLREQHWTPFFLEIVILVLGVFIGLQVNNWNEARHDRARERAYLESIATELDECIEEIKVSIDLTKERMALDELLIKAATDPEVVRADPGRFIYAVTRGGYTYAPMIHGYTFEEIKATGSLEIIRDRKLMLDLMKFYANVQGNSQWEYIKASNQSEYIRRSAGILTAHELLLAPASSHELPTIAVDAAMQAYKRMMDRPDFISWVPTVLFYRTSDLEASGRWLEAAMDLRSRILAETGVDAPSGAAKAPHR